MPEKMSSEEAQKRYQNASELFREGKYREALAELNDVAQFYPNPEVLKAQQACWERLNGPSPALDEGGVSGARDTANAAGARVRRAPYVVSGLLILVVVAVSAYFGIVRHGRGSNVTSAAPAQATEDKPIDQTSSIAAAGPASKPDSEFAPDDFDPNTPFDLKKEVRRVMLDPRVPDITQPQWRRESYQPIIDKAREHRLAIENPYTDGVTHPEKFPTEVVILDNVPPNITGKKTFRMRYVSDARPASKQDTMWGDDEDIIYLTGSCNITELTILPGTIALVAAFQDDTKAGALTLNEIASLRQVHANKPTDVQFHIHGDPYVGHFARLQASRRLTARATSGSPILMCSDSTETSPISSVTSYDWSSYGFGGGVIDQALVLDCEHGDALSGDTLVSRSYFDNHLGTGKNGPGWVTACRFGHALNECIDAPALSETSNSCTVMFCRFHNAWTRAGITLYDGISAIIRNNDFGLNAGVGTSSDSKSNTELHFNCFGPEAQFIHTGSTCVAAERNWWSTVDIDKIRLKVRDGNERGYGPGIVSYGSPLLGPDEDLDGLTDDEERTLGTSPDKMDSDNDGRIDGLEVNGDDPCAVGPTPKTDPLNPDSDGDGVKDGLEIYRGTDPADANSK